MARHAHAAGAGGADSQVNKETTTKKTSENRWATSLALTALLAGVLAASPLPAAEPQTIALKDWTGRGFAPDLVNYTIPADGARGCGCWIRREPRFRPMASRFTR